MILIQKKLYMEAAVDKGKFLIKTILKDYSFPEEDDDEDE